MHDVSDTSLSQSDLSETGHVAVVPEAITPAVADGERLAALLLDHALWLKSAGEEGKRAVLREMDFSGAYLAGVDLSQAQLRGAVFAGADLRGALLSEADCVDADFRGANLSHTELSRTNFTRAQLDNANLDHARGEATNFTAAHLAGVHCHAATLVEAVLRDAQAEQADFTRTHFKRITARGAVFRGALFKEADLSEAELKDADFTGAVFAHTVLTGAQCRGADFTDITVGGTDLSAAQDIADHYRTAAYLKAMAELQAREAALAERERQHSQEARQVERQHFAVDKVRALVERLYAHDQHFHQQVGNLSRWFVQGAVLWAMVTGGFLALVASQLARMEMQQWNLLELSVLFSVLAFVLLLFGMSTARTVQLSRQYDAHEKEQQRLWKAVETLSPRPLTAEVKQAAQAAVAHVPKQPTAKRIRVKPVELTPFSLRPQPNIAGQQARPRAEILPLRVPQLSETQALNGAENTALTSAAAEGATDAAARIFPRRDGRGTLRARLQAHQTQQEAV